ncbi:autotransporter domain-containing protein [Bradyrhizobium sp. 1]|uniref:autotransporter domain-containing protein n=1 Tax=Bradyrhizobium sp. 1 TaxID=241591 RepID=UPI001FF9DE90|nr:autotransporter domain-containing protein [Bradyrhizobium sp. 1]MCK1393936.1 autotransporter domain-containing protein [Bradyrhizobium sp. 1]
MTINAVTATGGKYGIFVDNSGIGATIVTATGPVTGTSTYGILAANGAVSFNGDGTVSSVAATRATNLTIQSANVTGGLYGIYAANMGTGVTAITANGVAQGREAGVFARSNAQPINIIVARGGEVRNAAIAPDALAIDASGGPVTLTNNGRLTGTIRLGPLGNSVTNNSLWTTTGANDFGGGSTALVNESTGTIQAAAAGSSATVNFNGLQSFINRGRISLQNGVAGDVAAFSGNVGFASGSSHLLDVDTGRSDRITTGGTATLSGGTVNAAFAPGSYVQRQYQILNAAGGVSGSFASINTNLPAWFTPSLSYDGNNAYLTLTPTPASAYGGLSLNQTNVINALINSFNTAGGIPMSFAALGPSGLTQASGETATGSQQTTLTAMNQFMGLLTDPFVAGRGDAETVSGNAAQFADEDDAANAYASRNARRPKSERDAFAAIYRKALPPAADPFAQRWSVWAAGFGGSQTTDGNLAAGANNSTSRIFGMAAGADYILSPNTTAGFALAGGGTNFSVVNGGSGRSDLFQAGAFVRHTIGAAYVSGALAYGWQDVTTDRTVTIAGVDRLRAQFNANAYSGRLEGGYRFVTPWIGGLGLTPYAAGQFTTFDLPAYAESVVSGANTFALAYGSKSVTDSRSELGIRADKSWAMPNAILTLRGRAAWAHDFNPDHAINSTFQALPGASFTVNGARQASESALTTASVEMKWMNGWSAAGTFEGEFSDVTRSYAGKGVVRYAW